MLSSQIGRNVLAYVDDIVVKSARRSQHLKDLRETFGSLRRVGLRLNPEKCVFEVQSGRLLGFLVSKRGIEVEPQKI